MQGIASELHEVVTNLIFNAVDALPEGGVVQLRVAAQDDGVSVQVRDNGSGIDPKAMSQIFDAFFTTKDENKGTGLGLATSRSIAAEHGGHILVGSRLGEGASFALLLPRLG